MNGVPQCELRRPNRPCVADADFLTAKRGHTNSLRLACRQHLPDFLATPHTASWTAVLPLAASPDHQRWAGQLQAAYRLLLARANRQYQQAVEHTVSPLRRLLIPHDQMDFI